VKKTFLERNWYCPYSPKHSEMEVGRIANTAFVFYLSLECEYLQQVKMLQKERCHGLCCGSLVSSDTGENCVSNVTVWHMSPYLRWLVLCGDSELYISGLCSHYQNCRKDFMKKILFSGLKAQSWSNAIKCVL
jgi:hypothetical protein